MENQIPSKCEICIIGTGAGGASVAYALTTAGIKDIVVLESGIWRDDPKWETKYDNDEFTALKRSMNRPADPGEAYTAYNVETDQIRLGQLFGLVGGYMVFYAAAFWRFRREDFIKRTLWQGRFKQLRPTDSDSGIMDWPVDTYYKGRISPNKIDSFYDVLLPYYRIAESLLGVSGEWGADPSLNVAGETSTYLPELPFHKINEILADGARKLPGPAGAWRPFHTPMGISSVDMTKRATVSITSPSGIKFDTRQNDLQPCVSCNFCSGYPCVWHAKNSADEVLLRPIKKHHGIHVATGVTARRIVPSEDGRSGHKVYFSRNDKPATSESIECRVLILAANAIQSPRLLKISGLEGRRFGTVGQFITFHMDVKRSAFLPQLQGPAPDNSSPVLIKKLAVMDFYLPDKHSDNYINHASIQTGSKPGAIAYGKDHVDRRARYPEFFEVQTIVEDLPQARNAVGLSTGTDRFGERYALLTHSFDQMDIDAANTTLGRIEQLIKTSGGELAPANLQPNPTRVRPNGSHLMGSLRMARDPQYGAVDGMCRLYGLENLFVADGSIFTTSAGVNPALTIAANAFRVADYIYEQMYREKTKST